MKCKSEFDQSLGSEGALPPKVLRTIIGGNRPEEPKNIDGDMAAAMTSGMNEAGNHDAQWQPITRELQQSADHYRALMDRVDNTEWRGPTATAMADSAAAYAAWLNSCAKQAAEAAESAKAAAQQFEKALKSMDTGTTVQEARDRLFAVIPELRAPAVGQVEEMWKSMDMDTTVEQARERMFALMHEHHPELTKEEPDPSSPPDHPPIKPGTSSR